MSPAEGRPGILSLGRVYCDLIFTDVPRMPTMGTEVFAGGLGLHAGGGAAITAAHLVRLGRPAFLAAELPATPFGDIVQRDLDAAGVDTSLCSPAVVGADPQVTVAITGANDRAFLSRRVGRAAPVPRLEDLRRLGIGHLHIGELATLMEMPDLLELAKAAGVTVSVDCGWDDAITPLAGPLIARCDIFLPNEMEVEKLDRLGLRRPFAPVTVVKCGMEGARAETADGQAMAPARPLHAIDTTGAGDAFNAGFLDAWLKGRTLEACLVAGNESGAHAIMVRGGFAARETAAQPAE